MRFEAWSDSEELSGSEEVFDVPVVARGDASKLFDLVE